MAKPRSEAQKYGDLLTQLEMASNREEFFKFLDSMAELLSPDNSDEILIYSTPIAELYLGTDKADYSKFDCVFNMAKEIDRKVPDFFPYYKYGLDDMTGTFDPHILPFLFEEFTKVSKKKRKILVHCGAGRSRSLTTVAVFLNQYYHQKPLQLVRYLYDKNWFISPNVEYCKYLSALQFPI